MPIVNPRKRQVKNRKATGVPTNNASPTPSAGKGVAKSSKTSQRFNRALLYRAKGEKII